jgi:hypothetical protein
VAGAVLGNLDGVLNDFSRGSRFGMFWETVVISGFGIRSSCRVASARLRLPQFFSWQAQYYGDLDEKVAET